jgi:hypothetical protein
MFVMCVIRHLVIGTVLKDIKLYIVLSALVFEMFVIMHTVIRAV